MSIIKTSDDQINELKKVKPKLSNTQIKNIIWAIDNLYDVLQENWLKIHKLQIEKKNNI